MSLGYIHDSLAKFEITKKVVMAAARCLPTRVADDGSKNCNDRVRWAVKLNGKCKHVLVISSMITIHTVSAGQAFPYWQCLRVRQSCRRYMLISLIY